MTLRTPLSRVRDHGSSGHGVEHWWQQRLSAIALVPLSLWFVFSLLRLLDADHAVLRAWFANHGNLVLMVLFLGTLFYHASLGLQVVIEDYVHGGAAKLATLIAVKFFLFILGASAILAALKIAFAG